ncbi:Crp/Fnr family transcriptional regulator [Cyanobium sp. T1B-Tous]|jgi:CRP-like cAMP-binding protein|uniref:Crp/Fnr family transcriptional regulator n=1 Tax=Cyanobium sp. T1B-Tous TaxID=2823721 RepID=UPI0020CEA62E|nr:Crp/Fnr family transcriptional regulator [Cyanobium sp. T1B-Tous]MCP9805365.1 Crp/Fnr family transcriptional regulator [Cyanobium sp. T1B-Tous]MCX5940420.1 Crp/Fnr family transcriptional regulator [Cyanobium sp. LacPavin_0818_WC50_MAG_67_9]
MVFTPSLQPGRSDSFRDLLETSYEKRSLVHLSAGSQVPLLKRNVWLVVRGMVKLTAISIQGDELLLGLAGPNEPFGDPLTNVEAYAATTLVDTDLLCVSCEEIQRSPHLAMGLLQGMAARYRQSEALLALLGLRRIEDRVRGFLELLANDYGQPCEQGLRLQIKLTHQELASTLSTTRVTVTRILGALRDEGWLQIDSQRRLVVSHLPHQRNPHR